MTSRSRSRWPASTVSRNSPPGWPPSGSVPACSTRACGGGSSWPGDAQAHPAVLMRLASRRARVDPQSPPSPLLAKLRRVRGAELGVLGLSFGLELEAIGAEGGITLAEALTAVVDEVRTDVVLIVDEVQHLLASEDGTGRWWASSPRGAARPSPTPPRWLTRCGVRPDRVGRWRRAGAVPGTGRPRLRCRDGARGEGRAAHAPARRAGAGRRSAYCGLSPRCSMPDGGRPRPRGSPSKRRAGRVMSTGPSSTATAPRGGPARCCRHSGNQPWIRARAPQRLRLHRWQSARVSG